MLTYLFDQSGQIISLLAVGGEPPLGRDGERRLIHTAEYYLTSRGLANNYKEAELVIGVLTSIVMVNFIEEFPPLLAGINGAILSADDVIFAHKDQLDCCRLDWPLKDQAEFMGFFKYAELGGFDTNALFDRFAFIDGYTGRIVLKNGAGIFLRNGLGLDDIEVKSVTEAVRSLSGFSVCWSSFPEAQELRDFLSCIEVNEAFTKVLDYEFGPPSERLADDRKNIRQKRVGRPPKKDKAAQVYWTCFPEGHAAQGKSWKEALASVNENLTVPVSAITLKRAVGPVQ